MNQVMRVYQLYLCRDGNYFNAFKSAATISFTRSESLCFGSQPSLALAFAGFPINNSTSVGLKYSGSTPIDYSKKLAVKF